MRKPKNTGYMFCLFHKDLYFNHHIMITNLREEKPCHIVGSDKGETFYFSANLTRYQYNFVCKVESLETNFLYKSKRNKNVNDK